MRSPQPRLLALDIGATKLAIRAETAAARWETTVRWPVDGVTADLTVLRDLIADAGRRTGGSWDRVAVAAAPTIDAAGQVSAWPSRPSWVGTALFDVLREATGRSPLIADDGSLAALAEADAAGCADLAYLGLGTGLGGGLVTGGRLVRGAFGGAGEIGHLTVEPYGPRCVCGRRGCLQARVSGPALARRSASLRGRTSSTEDLVEGAREGRRWAQRALDEAAVALARAVSIINELVEPAEVRLGGGLGAALPMLPERVAAALASMGRPGRRLPRIAPAVLGASASLAGAVCLARRPELAADQA